MTLGEIVDHKPSPFLLLESSREAAEVLVDAIVSEGGRRVFRSDGNRMVTSNQLFEELSVAFSLPDYFGRNWNALDECINDLDWARADAYVFVIFNADSVLKNEPPKTFDIFLKILLKCCSEWSSGSDPDEPWARPPTPFHVIFQCERAVSLVGRQTDCLRPNLEPLQ